MSVYNYYNIYVYIPFLFLLSNLTFSSVAAKVITPTFFAVQSYGGQSWRQASRQGRYMQQTWAEAFRNCRAIGYSAQLYCILLALQLFMAAICMARKKGYMMTVMPECQKKSRIERNKKALKKAADSGNPEYLFKH